MNWLLLLAVLRFKALSRVPFWRREDELVVVSTALLFHYHLLWSHMRRQKLPVYYEILSEYTDAETVVHNAQNYLLSFYFYYLFLVKVAS